MRASELIQKILELTQKEGKDLEVVSDYTPGFDDLYHPVQPDYTGVWDVTVEREDLDNENDPVIVIA